MARPSHPFGYLTYEKRVTRSLLKFCRDHALTQYLPELKGCLKCLEKDDPKGAFEYYQRVRPHGPGSITDCAPEPINSDEDTSYAHGVLEALVAQWCWMVGRLDVESDNDACWSCGSHRDQWSPESYPPPCNPRK